MNRIVFLALLTAAVTVPACRGEPERSLQLQGTVTSIGYARPVRAADVLIEWPASLGGGVSQLKTDSEGRYAVNRTLRTDTLRCEGLTLTVRAPGFASAYSRRDSTQALCGDSILNLDFKLFPLQ